MKAVGTEPEVKGDGGTGPAVEGRWMRGIGPEPEVKGDGDAGPAVKGRRMRGVCRGMVIEGRRYMSGNCNAEAL